MAFIYNIKNEVLTECINKDMIKICRKDPLRYIVESKKEDIHKKINELKNVDISQAKIPPLSKMNNTQLKEVAESLGLIDYESLTNKELIEVIKERQK